jgi:hypothetical protein
MGKTGSDRRAVKVPLLIRSRPRRPIINFGLFGYRFIDPTGSWTQQQ